MVDRMISIALELMVHELEVLVDLAIVSWNSGGGGGAGWVRRRALAQTPVVAPSAPRDSIVPRALRVRARSAPPRADRLGSPQGEVVRLLGQIDARLGALVAARMAGLEEWWDVDPPA